MGEFRVLRPEKAVHFLAILDYGRPCDLASEVDGENGETDVGDFGTHIASRVFGRNRRCAAFSVIRKRG